MMPKNRHTATAPCGTVLHRNSDSRTYTHCVAIRSTFESAEAYAHRWYSDRPKERDGYIEACRKRRDEGYYDKYRAYGWNGRLDLAEKLKRELMRGDSYADVVILPATVVYK
jgi:hypothetical protein